MSERELLKKTAEAFNGKMLSVDDFNRLVDEAKTQEEISFYGMVYNYLLAKRQKEVMANEKY
jgi:hypothetical protein